MVERGSGHCGWKAPQRASKHEDSDPPSVSSETPLPAGLGAALTLEREGRSVHGLCFVLQEKTAVWTSRARLCLLLQYLKWPPNVRIRQRCLLGGGWSQSGFYFFTENQPRPFTLQGTCHFKFLRVADVRSLSKGPFFKNLFVQISWHKLSWKPLGESTRLCWKPLQNFKHLHCIWNRWMSQDAFPPQSPSFPFCRLESRKVQRLVN